MKKKFELPNVTLIAATSVEIEQHQIALKISSQNIGFGAVKLLSSLSPKKKYYKKCHLNQERKNENEFN